MLERLRGKERKPKPKSDLVRLTPEAVEALRTYVHASPDAPETAGLRLFVKALDRPRNQKATASLGSEIAEGPQAGDTIIEEDGVLIYVDRGAVHFLERRKVEIGVDGTRLNLRLVD